MFTKKVILPVAALAMTALVGCGDDSSSSGPSSNVAPASVPTLEDALKLTCSATENFCAKVFVEEEMIRDTMQCDGKAFTPMMLGKPVAGCENAAPADPAAETPADPAAETPADPAAETPADPAAETPVAGDVIYCIVPGVMGGCEALPAAMKDQCETLLEGQLVDACPAE